MAHEFKHTLTKQGKQYVSHISGHKEVKTKALKKKKEEHERKEAEKPKEKET